MKKTPPIENEEKIDNFVYIYDTKTKAGTSMFFYNNLNGVKLRHKVKTNWEDVRQNWHKNKVVKRNWNLDKV